MVEPRPEVRSIRFGVFEADLRTGELRKNGMKVKLSGQPFHVLAILLERPGDIFTREELQQRLWPDTYVDVERNLNTAVNKIREVLGDSAEFPRFVETLPRRGYRFIGAVETDVPQPGKPSLEKETIGSKKPSRLGFGGVFVPGVLAIGISAAWYLLRPLPAPRITEYAQITLDGQHKDIVGTDGSRLYMNLNAGWDPNTIPGLGIYQLSIPGGRSAQLGIVLPGRSDVPEVQDVSPDGSNLLVLDHPGNGESEVWVVGSIGHPARYLTRAQDAVFSPDGNSVVYATAHGDLYRVPTEGGASNLIRASPGPESTFAETRELALSPDGRKIRFTRDGSIWEVSASGSGIQELLPDWKHFLKCCGRWTRDGAFYIFVAGPLPLPGSSGTHLWAIDERHLPLRQPIPGPIQLTEGPIGWGRPIPSRDGGKIFAPGLSLRGELVRYDNQSGQLHPWLGGISAQEVYFSTDGKSLSYVSFPDGVLWRANLDGSGPIELTKPPFYPAVPRWSPDGKQIAFTQYPQTGVSSTYVVSAEGGTPRKFIPEDNEPQNDANWSPDGRSIVYCDCDWHGKIEIHIFDLAHRSVTTLPDSQNRYSPRWSPDGRYIAALHRPDDPDLRNDLELFELETRQWTTLVHAPDIAWPNWSPDSRYIYFRRASGVFRVAITGGSPQKVADLQGFRTIGDWIGLDPAGAPILLRDVSSEEIYALKLATK